MTTTLDRDDVRTSEARAVSPTVRQSARRAVPWIVLAAIAVLVALFGLLLNGSGAGTGVPLAADNAGPVGGRAVAEVLRQQGVTVRTATTLAGARSAADGATVLVFDPAGNLPASGYRELGSAAAALVLVEPRFAALQEIAPGVSAAGTPSGPVDADCSDPAAQRAERIDPRATDTESSVSTPGTFRVDGGGTACFRTEDGRASFVSTSSEGRPVALIGSAAVIMNDTVARAGNAALALNVLGGHRTLVWYLPGIDDRAVTGPPSLTALTPGWVTPVILLFVLVGVAAAVWRGRRFGPLVVEDLPVVVRAGETREGRARLYQRSSARLRAADSLRIGAVGRLARAAGLPRSASAAEVADAVAALTGADRRRIHGLLIDTAPATDADLMHLSDDLAELESAAARAVSPDLPGPTGRMDE